MKRLSRVQQASALQVTGALRTTPDDLLEVHVGLTLMNLRITKICVQAAARTSLLGSHPLCRPAEKAAQFVQRHWAPLHYILKAWGKSLGKMEVIEVVRHLLDWKCPVRVVVGEIAEEVVEREQNNKADIRIYMDGSGYKGMVGAVVVLYRGMEKEKVLRKQLGSEEDHMVYKGESVEQVLGFELLRGEMRRQRKVRTVTMGTDNQVGLRALEVRESGIARYIMDEVLEGIHKVKVVNSGMDITVCWTPGHIGIPGNEKADKEVKCTVEGKETELRGLHFLRKPLKMSKATVLATYKKQ
ncbi:hypothetical protein J132_09064 [Termitomyces sp. J132]|nr:hypothetical protein J132_09064 [Termitomyces sp. J132]